jgi:CheY-like chemotaxis protein
VLRESLTDQLRSAGAELVPLGKSDSATTPDAVLIDAGTASVTELPARPDGRARAIVLLTPAARGQVDDMRKIGFSGYLVKPVREASLIERLLSKPVTNGAMQAELPSEEAPPPPPVAAPPESLGSNKAPQPAKSAPVRAVENTGGLKILLAEDNPINAMLTRELLKRRGHRVSEVTCGEDAVKACASERFDLVLTDIHMPGLDGVEATRRIRAEEQAKGRTRVPIVALTADALETGKRACQEAGMDGFLTKPIDPAELTAVLNELFPESRSACLTDAAA